MRRGWGGGPRHVRGAHLLRAVVHLARVRRRLRHVEGLRVREHWMCLELRRVFRTCPVFRT